MCWRWVLCVYPAFVVAGVMGSLLQRVTFFKRQKSNQKRLPHHAGPRLGSAFPHSGVAPGVAVSGHPWPRTAFSASLPRYPLCNACARPHGFTGPLSVI
jgi:hypothetical protein